MSQDALQAYYSRGEERDRLAHGKGRLEFLRTTEIVSRTLPPAPAVVADIGGGPGRYTDWLVALGHEVIHRDLVADHVDQVRRAHPDIDTRVGDARSLDLSDESVDVVLLLGPLYHLPEGSDRVQALREDGGVLHAAAITRWATRLDGILVQRFHQKYPGLIDIAAEGERTGWFPPVHPAGFNCAAHTPAQLRGELEDASLDVEALVTVEGVAFAFADLDDRLDDTGERTLLLDMLRAVEDVPDLLGVGPHLLATARR
jgi:SAM-dependent methyltransferase